MLVPVDQTILFLSIITFLIISAVGKLITSRCEPLPYNYLIFFLAGIFTSHCVMLATNRWNLQTELEPLTKAASRTLIEIFSMPVIFFYIGYSTNLNIYKHSTLQILVLGFAGNLMQTLLFSLILNIIFSSEVFNNFCLFTISIMCLPYTSTNSIKQLQSSYLHTKHIEQLLEGEALVSTLMALLLYNFIHVWSYPFINSIFLVITKETKSVAIGCLVGVISGVLVSPMVTSSDASALICYTIGTLYLTFFFSFIILDSPVSVVALTLGITMGKVKKLANKNIEVYLDNFWTWNFYIVEVLVFTTSGLKVSFRYMKIFDDALKALTILIFTLLLRAINWISCAPLMNFISGFRMPFKIVIVGFAAGYKSSIPLLFAFDSVSHGIPLNNRIESIVSLFVFFYCLFNCIVFPLLCKYTGLKHFKKGRLQKIGDLLERINGQKEKTIEYLQNNIISANANWQTVNYITTINKPKFNLSPADDKKQNKSESNNNLNVESDNYLAQIVGDDEDSILYHNPDGFQLEDRSSEDLLAKENDNKEYIINRTRKKILEIEQISYNRLHENEIISNKTHSFLLNMSKTPTFEKLWKIKKPKMTYSGFSCLIRMFIVCFHSFKEKYLAEPANCFRFNLFHVIISPSYKIFLTTTITLDCLSQLVIVFFYYSNEKNKYDIMANYLQMTDYICYGFFVGEIIFQFIGCGFGEYFKQRIWIIEFFVSIIIRSVEQFLLHLNLSFNNFEETNILQENEIIILLKLVFILRLVAIIIYMINRWIPCCNNCMEQWKYRHIMNDYEKKYCIALGHDDILPHYETLFELNKEINQLNVQWLKRRKNNKINMCILENNSKGLAVAMKSRYVGINLLKDSEFYLEELKLRGYIYEHEGWILKRGLNLMKHKLRKITNVAPSKPANILQNIFWLRGDYACRNYLLNHAENVTFEMNDYIIDYGEVLPSLYIITSGKCSYIYKPIKETIQKLVLLGILPNSDYFLHLRFQEVQQDLIDPGNLIGEFGIITGRPYNTRIRCENLVSAIKIPFRNIKKQFFKCHFGSIRLAKLWKTIGIRMSIKNFAPSFKMLSKESLILQLHRGLVPLLEKVKLININDDISDIILIEGTVKDSLTRYEYVAPVHIKANHQKLIVNVKVGKYQTSTRLMLIPKPGINRINILNSNNMFKEYITYSREIPKFVGDDICIKDRRKFKIIRQFLKKHKKYMLIDFILQINDPKISIPCCISHNENKKRKPKKNKIHS